MSGKYRLVTRSDFDGLVCAVLLRDIGLIDEIKFVHPKDMQDGLIDVSGMDITTNLPYVAAVNLCFDHHLSETIRNKERASNHIIDPNAPSAARVVYNYYGGKQRFPNISEDMMRAVDIADSAQYTIDDILHPKGWVLMNFLMDARTGLGRFKSFRISNYNLMMDLIDYCKNHNIIQILDLPDVVERSDIYYGHEHRFKDMLKKNTVAYGNLVVTDLTKQDPIYAGNRFVVYALNPEANISIQVMWGLKKEKVVFTVGNSIVNRTSKTNIGELMLKYGGGGHKNAGTCQVEVKKAEQTLMQLITAITTNG